MIAKGLLEYLRLVRLPIRLGLDGRAMADRFLGQVLVVQPDIPLERGFQVVTATDVVRAQNVSNAPVEALDHPVGLGPARRDEALLDAECGAALIEVAPFGRLVLSVGSKAVGEFLGVVGQARLGHERRCLVQRPEKTFGRAGALVGHEVHVYPARGAIDGHKGVAELVLVAHLWEIFDVDVHEARFMGLEGFAGTRLGICFLWPLRDAVLAHYSIQRRAVHSRLYELPRHRQQVVRRQAEGRAQIQHPRVLPVSQRLAQPVRCVTSIRRRFTALPLDDRVPRLTKTRCQFVNGTFGLANRPFHQRCRRRVLVQAQQDPGSFSHRAKTSARVIRPISNWRVL